MEGGNNPIIPFYIDDLDRKDDANVSFLPHLKHLSFSDCLLRMQGLLAIATSHASTLQELELSRVTFDPSYCPQSWSEIGVLCKSALPILAYLRLVKLVTHFPKRAAAPLDEMPIPERWNKGLEGVTSYEWRKGVRGRWRISLSRKIVRGTSVVIDIYAPLRRRGYLTHEGHCRPTRWTIMRTAQ